MALSTKSAFYFGHEITESNRYLDFKEGVNSLTATLNLGYYSATELSVEVGRAMIDAGSQVYGCGFNRVTGQMNINAASTFQLLRTTGNNYGSGIWDILGFGQGLDLTGSNSYTSGSRSGYAYYPQFFLLDYVSTEERQSAVEATLNITGSGKVEVIKYGLQKFMECSIDYITNSAQPADGMIDNNSSGKEDAVFFMRELTKKGHIEFMPDRDDVLTYETLMLESTELDNRGLGFKLTEMLGDGLTGYYRTGKLVFRKIE